MAEQSEIDFVILWVDGADKAWQKAFELHVGGLDGDKRTCRYRDWDNLRYIFRGFETFTPWVRKIHLVTWGHLPPWLNTKHEKIRIVKHSDFLAEKNLPVFSCNPIEVNLHRISGLADKFVYFNDDTFVLRQMKQECFFFNGLPCDLMAFNAIYDSPIAHIKINDIQAIHRNFDKFQVVSKNFRKIFNLKCNFIDFLKTILLMPWPKMTGFYDPHQPQPFLKSTFEEVWEKEEAILSKTSSSKVRVCTDVNQYLFRYWQLCKGEFYPRSFRRTFSKMIETMDDVTEFYEKITSRQYEMICINDNISDDILFERARCIIADAIEQILPHKSSFEVD